MTSLNRVPMQMLFYLIVLILMLFNLMSSFSILSILMFSHLMLLNLIIFFQITSLLSILIRCYFIQFYPIRSFSIIRCFLITQVISYDVFTFDVLIWLIPNLMLFFLSYLIWRSIVSFEVTSFEVINLFNVVSVVVSLYSKFTHSKFSQHFTKTSEFNSKELLRKYYVYRTLSRRVLPMMFI